jgi:predicted nucleic acid-binding protein
MTHLVVLDNEAVQALSHPAHKKHVHVMSHVQVVVANRKGRGLPVTVVVPTAVRVEAGWDRTMPAWAFLNRLLIGDITLDGSSANIAASIRQDARVSVADAHIGAVIRAATAAKVTVITSDPEDIRRVAGDKEVNVVSI